MSATERPRLLDMSQCAPDRKPNVLILSGLPWHISEHAVRQYLMSVYPEEEPMTTRLYVDSWNGSSRGHCFVEYASSSVVKPTGANTSSNNNNSMGIGAASSPAADLDTLQQRVAAAPLERMGLTATLCFLTSTRWDRAGHLPDLPFDPPPLRRAVAAQTGYGDEGYMVRCGPRLGLPNTVTQAWLMKRAALRKRLRAASSSPSSSSSSSSSSADS